MSGIFEMKLRDNALVPGPEVSTPSRANINVFNFAKADITRDGSIDSYRWMTISHRTSWTRPANRFG